MVIIVLGISGSGKRAVGQALAEELGCHFYNGDDFHPQANLEKIEQGLPLTEQDREPWLRSLRNLIEDHAMRERQAVIACHYLNRERREQLLTDLTNVYFVYLEGDFQTLLDRIRGRKTVEPEQLKRQYDLLEESQNIVVVKVQDDPAEVVSEILHQLKLTPESPS